MTPARSAGGPEASHVSATGRAVRARRLGRKLLAQRAELGAPGGPGGRTLMGLSPLEGPVVVGVAEVPGGAELNRPVICVAAPVTLRWHVQALWLGHSLPRHPGVVGGTVDLIGQR